MLPQLRADGLRAHHSGSVLDLLTTREHDVLLGMVEGKRSLQIAAELFLSVNTVRTHTHNLCNKLKVHSRLEAAGIARATGLLPRLADAPTGERERVFADQFHFPRHYPGSHPESSSSGGARGEELAREA
ncbi:response regulator transcription factor [Amycolatopsis magusensis]|uniref:response regulator transcription factor n=1 Tax=Amycolatopsis magusensis TaxID=882444 RepID=UPI003C2D8041